MKNERAIGNLFGKLFKRREFLIIAVVVLVFIAMSFINPIFINPGNLKALGLSVSCELIIALGMTVLMVAGDFDMSTAANLALSGGMASMAALAGLPIWCCVLIGVFVGCICGAFNGFWVAYVKIPPFVVTLASMYIFRGILLGVTHGNSISKLPSKYKLIGQHTILGIQMPIWYALILLIIAVFLVSKVKFFRQAFYIGGNSNAAKLSGISVSKTKFIYFVILGGLCGLTGVIYSSRIGAITPTAAQGMELEIVTAVIVGGASMNGGQGSIIGTFFGAVLMVTITNIVNIQGASVYWQTFITGVVLLLAVLADRITTVSRIKREIKHAELMLHKNSAV